MWNTKIFVLLNKKLLMELTCQGFLLPKHKDVVNQPKSSTEEGRCDSTYNIILALGFTKPFSSIKVGTFC